MPAEATPYWIDKDEPNLAAVVGLAHGDGSVLILGFDWFDSDGAGWETVLATAVTQPQAAVTDASVDAGDDAVFVISIDSSFAQPVAIGYQTVDGTATAGLDYTATSGTVVIPAGSTSAEVVVATSHVGCGR